MNRQPRIQLDEQGSLVFRNVLSLTQVEMILAGLEELWMTEGEHAGEEKYIEPTMRRHANLAGKGEAFRDLYAELQPDQANLLPAHERELLGLNE